MNEDVRINTIEAPIKDNKKKYVNKGKKKADKDKDALKPKKTPTKKVATLKDKKKGVS